MTEIQEELAAEFLEFDDWMDCYQLLIDKGQELTSMDERYRTDANLIEGCQSKVWLHAEQHEGVVHFDADSNTVIVKGIIALLLQVLNDRTPEQILECDLFIIERIGLQENLSPTRSNGLVSMIKQLRSYAQVFSIMNQKEGSKS